MEVAFIASALSWQLQASFNAAFDSSDQHGPTSGQTRSTRGALSTVLGNICAFAYTPPMNKEPLTPVTEAHCEAYARDGVVCLRGMFDQAWIDLLRPEAEAVRKGTVPRLSGNFGDMHLWHRSEVFRRYVFESPAGEIVGRTMRSKEVRFFFEKLWFKEPRSDKATPWHTDRMSFPVDGGMVPSFWMALTPITKANSLECVAGSHTDATAYWNWTHNGSRMIRPDDRPDFIDYNLRRDDSALTFLSWDMEPGDCLLIHPWCYHYSCGNPLDQWRVALSTRWLGDDVTWNPRPESINLPGISFGEMVEGAKPQGPLVPLIWSEDGRQESYTPYQPNAIS